MNTTGNSESLVYTLLNRCRVCYTCVRECPVKAIRISNGQAEVISERCIACGNCVRVCSQGAKQYRLSTTEVRELLASGRKVALCIAPSFPAEFGAEFDTPVLTGMIRALGFSHIVEVSFGADLVAERYRQLFDENPGRPVITSDCPAVVNYIQQYHPSLVNSLAPVDSPAMATARVVRRLYGDDISLVFAGPCIAKKEESELYDSVITFAELRRLFVEEGIDPVGVTPSGFDPPEGGRGALFPVNHGLLTAINRREGLGEGEVAAAEGRSSFIEAVKNFEEGVLSDQHLQVLCCDGCILGPGMTTGGEKFVRRKRVNSYVTAKLETLNPEGWEENLKLFSDLDLSRDFSPSDQRLPEPSAAEIERVLESMGRELESDRLNCGACGYATCREHAIAVVEGLAGEEMCLPYAIEQLHLTVDNLNESNRILADTRQALKQSEKLASMGQVSAGIAHELNNPLGVITLYSSIIRDELADENPLKEDILIINEQAERCRRIVGGLLNFARKNQVRLEECDATLFMKGCFKSVIVPKGISLRFENSLADHSITVDADQMTQAVTNLLKNSVEALGEEGIITVRMRHEADELVIEIEDNGPGIPEENREKIFTPFFTTKGAGKGTGLGLPLVYGIVKMHRGSITVTSTNGEGSGGTCFRIAIPANLKPGSTEINNSAKEA